MPFFGINDEVLLDALCSALEGLTEEQAAFASSEVAPKSLSVLGAPAGSGKTHTVAALIVHLLLNPDVKEVKMLAFLNTTVGTLRERVAGLLEKIGLDRQGVTLPPHAIRTIHATALRGLPRGLDSKINVLSSADVLMQHAKTVFDELLLAERKRIVASDDLSESDRVLLAKSSSVDDFFEQRFPDAKDDSSLHAMGVGELTIKEFLDAFLAKRRVLLDTDDNPSALPAAERVLFERLNNHLLEVSCVDFPLVLSQFLRHGSPVAGSGEALVVDEGQDLTRVQLKIINKALENGAAVFIVGDAAQSITTFAGASSNPIRDAVKEARERGYAVCAKRLTRNFRSTDAIIRASEKVLSDKERVSRGEITGTDPGERVTFSHFEDETTEARAIVDTIKAQLADDVEPKIKPNDITVLRYRRWAHNDAIVVALRAAKIPVYLSGDSSNASTALRAAFLLAIATDQPIDTDDNSRLVRTVQHALRALQGVTCTDALAESIVRVSQSSALSLRATIFTRKGDILADFSSSIKDNCKRGANGDPIALNNARNALDVASCVFKAVSTTVDDIFNDIESAAPFISLRVTPLNIDGLFTPTNRLARMVRALVTNVVSHSKNCVDVSSLSSLVASFDFSNPASDLFAHHLEQCVNRLSVNKEDAVYACNAHKFKGCETRVAIVTGLDSRFDFTTPDKAKKALLGGSTADELLKRTKQLQEEVDEERAHVAHVLLSRARERMFLFSSGTPGRMATLF